jgi:prevent-host-death family protein
MTTIKKERVTKMISAGIKELKSKLSSYIDAVNEGEQVVITEHGREVAIIIPISQERKAINALVAAGIAHWAGGKPKGLVGIKIKGEPLSKTILEERR